jgi:hypothetical protein
VGTVPFILVLLLAKEKVMAMDGSPAAFPRSLYFWSLFIYAKCQFTKTLGAYLAPLAKF